MSFSDHYLVQESDIVLHVLPVHHVTGITATLLPFLWRGGCIEFRSGGFDPAWTWERFKQGNLSHFSGVPTIYMRLMQHYDRQLMKLPAKELSNYNDGAKTVRVMMCGTSALPRPLQNKWTKVRDGKHILTRYGGTEFGNVFSVPAWLHGAPDASVGVKNAGSDIQLSEGDEGEVLVRSGSLFSKSAFPISHVLRSLINIGICSMPKRPESQ